MSTNKINIEAVNARAREGQTPMTKIPSVEEVVDNFGKQFDALKMKPSKKSMPGLERELLKDFMRKALTADRLALLTELREWTENYLKKVNKYAESCHEENLIMLAYDAHSREMAIEHFKAHLDELIKAK